MPRKPSNLPPNVRRRLSRIARGLAGAWADEPGENRCGIWVRKTDLPTVTSQDIVDSDLAVDEKRMEALRGGAKPNTDETQQFLEGWIQSELEGCGNLEVVPSYSIARVCDECGNEGWALILRTGYSFTQIRTWLEDVFSSEEEAVAWMEKKGWCS